MKQISAIIFLIIISATLLAQENSSVIIKKWNLIEIEEFGSKYPLTDNQKNDFFELSADQKYHGMINGQTVEGTWLEKVGKYTLTPSKEKSVFKVNWIKLISIEKDNLVLSYQSVDLIKTSLFLQPAK